MKRRERAIDLLDAHEGGIIGLPDPEVLWLAAVSGRILLSHDANTLPMHLYDLLKTNSSPGVIIIPQDVPIGIAIEELVQVQAASTAEEYADLVTYLPR